MCELMSLSVNAALAREKLWSSAQIVGGEKLDGSSCGSYDARMLRISSVVLLSIAIIACSKSKSTQTNGSGTSSGSAVIESGSGAATSGSAMTGSAIGSAEGTGSAMAGSAEGSAAGSGSSAMANGSAADSAVAASDFDFDKLSHDDKVKFMKTKVMPTMKPAFQKFDGKEYASFTCKTCHGKDPQKVKYEMPNPELPKLDFEALKAGKGEPKMVEFMSKTVKPEMAKLLNRPEMTETVHDGFGCLDCHTMKQKK